MMKIEEMLDIFDIDEIEKMSPEECKGLLKGFFIGAGFIEVLRESVDKSIDKRYKVKKTHFKNPYTSSLRQDRQDCRHIQLVFETREKAEDTLDELCDLLESSKEGYVTVRQLYSIVEQVTRFDAANWVWYDLEDCTIEQNGDNYILKMPPAELKNQYRG